MERSRMDGGGMRKLDGGCRRCVQCGRFHRHRSVCLEFHRPHVLITEAIRALEFLRVPNVEIGTIYGAVGVEVTSAPGCLERELIGVPGIEVAAIDTAIEVCVGGKVTSAGRQIHGPRLG